MPNNRKQFWRYVRGLAAPVLLWGLFAAVLGEQLQTWLKGDVHYDEAALREWIEEARVFRETLPRAVRDYVEKWQRFGSDRAKEVELLIQAESIHEQLKSLGTLTLAYSGYQPLFPTIYSLQLTFQMEPVSPPPIDWDSNLPRQPTQYQELEYHFDPRATLRIQYQLHAYNKRRQKEQAAGQRLRWVSLLALAGTALALVWIYLVQRRERERERQRLLAQQQVARAEHLRLEEELRRREAEQRQEETERKLLEQSLATRAAESRALEMKSQLYASIGIMAGSYAHNIKNLLVRPNDLLRRCLEVDGLSADQEYMLQEVRQTLGTVTERLQQILRTVRRDPSRSDLTRLDLNEVVRDLHRTWQELAQEKWKLILTTEVSSEPLWIDADLSHLQQAVENLLFNARDATFEMRNHLRDEARRKDDLAPESRRQALIAAAAWKGNVVLQTRRVEDRAMLEVYDNGIGMTQEVRQRCTETHFSTKRNNAVYEGNSTGMGLGLSFVTVILEHHRATLEIESQPLQGTVFRVGFPLATVAPLLAAPPLAAPQGSAPPG
jgi:signal transduction histidine kinase